MPSSRSSPSPSSPISSAGTAPNVANDYYTFVVIGVVTVSILAATLNSFGNDMLELVTQGQLEMFLVEPVRWNLLPFAMTPWAAFQASITSALMILLSIPLGAQYRLEAVPIAILIVVLGLASTLAIGILGASIKILSKRADPVLSLYALAASVLSGVFFPIDLLPGLVAGAGLGHSSYLCDPGPAACAHARWCGAPGPIRLASHRRPVRLLPGLVPDRDLGVRPQPRVRTQDRRPQRLLDAISALMGPQPEVLDVVAALLDRLSTKEVSYVHWKSNEHLRPALRGETDLDLLGLPRPTRRSSKPCSESSDSCALTPARVRHIPGSESHLGFDASTGTLVHLDVQYLLTVGEQLLKNHRLPVEGWLLENSENLHGVRVPEPERELLLLYVRTMLKTTTRQLVRSRVRAGSPVPDRIMKEAVWLAQQVDNETLQLGGPHLRPRRGWRRADRVQRSGRGPTTRPRLRRRSPSFPATETGGISTSTHLSRLAEEGHSPSALSTLGEQAENRHPQAEDRRLWPARRCRRSRRIGEDPPQQGSRRGGCSTKLEVRHVYFGQPKGGVALQAAQQAGQHRTEAWQPRGSRLDRPLHRRLQMGGARP